MLKPPLPCRRYEIPRHKVGDTLVQATFCPYGATQKILTVEIEKQWQTGAILRPTTTANTEKHLKQMISAPLYFYCAHK